MVKVNMVNGEPFEYEPRSPHGFYIDGLLKKNLDNIKKTIKKDWDYVFVCDGEVGSGKSTFIQQLAWYLSDGNFSLKDITFTPEAFKKRVREQEKYRCVIFDEAFRGASSRSSLSRVNKDIVELMQEVRQKNLFIFFILPSIWDLDKNIKLHRCKGVFHVHTRGNRERGYWKFYPNDMGDRDYNAFQRFFDNPPNKYSYPARRQLAGVLSGRYTNWCPPEIDLGEYKNKKLEVFNLVKKQEKESINTVNPRKTREVEVTPELITTAKRLGLNMVQVCNLLGVPYNTAKYWLQNIKPNVPLEKPDDLKGLDNEKEENEALS